MSHHSSHSYDIDSLSSKSSSTALGGSVSSQQNREAEAARIERREEIAAWDAQSKLWLTYRVLREIDLRNFEASQAGTFDQPLSINGPVSLARFARNGGPDLQELRSASLLHLPSTWTESEC